KDIRLGLNINAKKLLVLNTMASKADIYSGKVFVSGLASIKGDIDDITIAVNAKTDKNSSISFNMASQTDLSESSFIRFYNPVADSIAKVQALKYKQKVNPIKINPKNKFKLILNLETTTDMAVGLDIRDVSMTGQLSVKGDGALRFQYELPSNTSSLFGTYTVQNGIFDFSMQNLLNKEFLIQNGGTIAWTGSIENATLNINALYPARTSLYPVLASVSTLNTESDLKRKVNVESVIQMTGKLTSPHIQFDINLLNVDPATKDLFFSVVNKDNESEMLKQTFSLLMFNMFMNTGDNSMMPSLANTALASSSEIIFSQFNNVLSKLSKDFDLGVNFRPEDNMSTSEFQVMMSGQLFDERLTIDGNIGVGGATKGQTPDPKNASNIVGDISVEWKFTDKLRLRAFNRSNEQDLMRNQSSYTQGLGIVYSRDFDYLGELFRQPKIAKIKDTTSTKAKRPKIK
ncbi:MAG: translocation/assembly module TamB domain-containing protein, partial [Bacteroidales bacterium]